MPSIPCKTSLTCPGSDDPLGNYSSEAPDRITFDAIGFPIAHPDNPLGDDLRDPLLPSYTAEGCEVVCVSNVSQQAANDCAAVDAYLCQNGGRNPPPDLPTVFYNAQQTCGFPCPDGSQFIWTVLAGTVVASTQVLADRIAAQIACARAAQFRLCLPSLQTACQNEAFSQTLNVITAAGSAVFTVTAGALPAGLTLTQTGPKTAIIAGTPTTAGTSPFTLTVQDQNGNYASKIYNFQVLGINPATLPNASIGVAYNQTLTAVGGTAPYTFAVELGALPDGLTLAPNGTISGTPTGAGTFDATISVTDSGTGFCTRDYTIVTAIAGYQICNWPGMLATMTVPPAWAASAQPAWNGVFTKQTVYGIGFGGPWPLWYFINASIGGKKVAASETVDWPNGPWPDNDGFTQLFWTGTHWQVYIGPCDLGFTSPDFLTYDGPANLNDPTGVYTLTTAAGTAKGPNKLTIQGNGSTASCCTTTADWLNNPGNCRLRITGYVDTLFPACATCNAAGPVPVFDGAFPQFGGLGQYNINTGLGISRSVHGKSSLFLQINWDPFAQKWTLGIQCQTGGGPINQWVGTSAGADPIGVYTQTAGCPGGPASVTVEGYSL